MKKIIKNLLKLLLCLCVVSHVSSVFSMYSKRKPKKKRFAGMKLGFQLPVQGCKGDSTGSPLGKRSFSEAFDHQSEKEESPSPSKICKRDGMFNVKSPKSVPQDRAPKQSTSKKRKMKKLKMMCMSGFQLPSRGTQDEGVVVPKTPMLGASGFQGFGAISSMDQPGYQLEQQPERQFITFSEFKKRHTAEIELEKDEFKGVIEKFIEIVKQQELGSADAWIKPQSAPSDKFFDIAEAMPRDRFFIQKRIVQPGAQIALHADVHGDADALIAYLDQFIDDNFNIRQPKLYLAFLGDYVDRGEDSLKVLYLLARAKIANPARTILLRGNHEDVKLNKLLLMDYTMIFADYNRMNTFYNMLPSAVFIGVRGEITNYALLCHGGIEPRIDPMDLLADQRCCVSEWVDQLDIAWMNGRFVPLKTLIVGTAKTHKSNIGDAISPHVSREIGFLWNEFIIEDKETAPVKKSYKSNTLSFGEKITLGLLHAWSSLTCRVRAIFRGHQHEGLMGQRLKKFGVYNSWAPNQLDSDVLRMTDCAPVWTLNACPGAFKPAGFEPLRDAYAILSLDQQFDKWQLRRFFNS